MIGSFLPDQEYFQCDGLPWEVSRTPDCLHPMFGRNRLEGARRFQTLFGVLFDSAPNQMATLDLYHTLGQTDNSAVQCSAVRTDDP